MRLLIANSPIPLSFTIILVLVLFFDFMAFVLAIAAASSGEARRVFNGGVLHDGKEVYCSYDFDVASRLGIAAFALLLATQSLIILASFVLCFDCTKGLNNIRAHARTIFVITFFGLPFLMAEMSLWASSMRFGGKRAQWASISCTTGRKMYFGIAVVFAFINALVSGIYVVGLSVWNVTEPNEQE